MEARKRWWVVGLKAPLLVVCVFLVSWNHPGTSDKLLTCRVELANRCGPELSSGTCLRLCSYAITVLVVTAPGYVALIRVRSTSAPEFRGKPSSANVAALQLSPEMMVLCRHLPQQNRSFSPLPPSVPDLGSADGKTVAKASNLSLEFLGL